MQADGDLVMTSAAGKPLWISHTSGAGNSLYVQDDGNLVIYDTLSRAVWATHTTAIVLIPGTTIPAGTTYVSNIYPKYSPGFIGRLAMQRDGNLVLYGKSKLVWNSNTHLPGSHAAYTVNGTLAVYSPGGTVLWRSHSYGPISAVILDCGSLEFYPLHATTRPTSHSPASPTNCASGSVKTEPMDSADAFAYALTKPGRLVGQPVPRGSRAGQGGQQDLPVPRAAGRPAGDHGEEHRRGGRGAEAALSEAGRTGGLPEQAAVGAADHRRRPDDDEVRELIDDSYDLVVAKLPVKDRP